MGFFFLKLRGLSSLLAGLIAYFFVCGEIRLFFPYIVCLRALGSICSND